ncbi:EPIDERMAL PATTERNING FACTOR-like protein 1 [Glycine soja]|nr:EPIDERMAL PATTERNING FACTOR-like protein 1 [Glycine soja]
MASFNSIQNSTTPILLITILITFLLHHLLCPVSCFNQPQHAIPPPDPLCEEKNRLGSMPPTCHNKCNRCHPCMAVQVPASPSHERVHPGLAPTAAMEVFFLQGNRYSNYKPLSWKCHCGDHFFNP